MLTPSAHSSSHLTRWQLPSPADHFHKTANHTGRADPQRFRIDADKLHWYIRKYRSHYTYWTNVPLHKLLVRYEDLRADPATELRRVVHFLGDSPEMASALLQEASAGQGMVKRASLVNDTLIRCAIADGRTAYNTQAPQRQHLFGIDMLGEEAVETILRELAPVICQLGYHELFPRWLKEKLAEVDGDRGSSAGEEIVTAERARLDRLQRYVAAGVDCAALETVVDFDPTRVSGAKAEGMRG